MTGHAQMESSKHALHRACIFRAVGSPSIVIGSPCMPCRCYFLGRRAGARFLCARPHFVTALCMPGLMGCADLGAAAAGVVQLHGQLASALIEAMADNASLSD